MMRSPRGANEGDTKSEEKTPEGAREPGIGKTEPGIGKAEPGIGKKE